MLMNQIRVAVVGTGNIGTDLCERLLLDKRFIVVAFIGRRADSKGLLRFKGRVHHLLHDGIRSLRAIGGTVDGIFDATSAYDHPSHWEECIKLGIWAIDLTPSKIGIPMVPTLIGRSNKFQVQNSKSANYSMVTCGGQSSAPVIFAFSKYSKGLREVEVSSSIASLSAGPATRLNIDEYINSTENLTTLISGIEKSKAILVINPSTPPVMMRTTVQMLVKRANLDGIRVELEELVKEIRRFVPGYEISVAPHFSSKGVLSATIKITGAGHYLPSYAGNLDIINAAAVETANLHDSQIRSLASR
jgi:acetaldehyde dehydrogenase (acetylating)